jgi:hypothetical protein
MRHALLIGLLSAGLSAGCLETILPSHQKQDSESGPDLAPPDMGGGGGDLAGSPGKADLAVDCVPRVAATVDGHHNPGTDCGTCHGGALPAAPAFTIAGTLFSAISGGTPVAGATIEVVQPNGTKIKLVTATNGNFYTEEPVTFPVTTRASGCPAPARPMIATVATAGGSCNSCHNATMQVWLP